MNQTPRACAVLSFAWVCFAAIMSFGNAAQATAPTLEWDPNPEPTVVGYNVYIGTSSGNYTQVVDVGATTSLPLTNLSAAVTYYFAVTAYDTQRLESPFSDEVWYTPRVDGTNATTLPFTMSKTTEGAVVRFSGQVGQRCWIVASSDLEHWQEVFSVNVTDLDVINFTDANTQQPQRFYRVVGSL
jgi:hypothetical protein